MQSRRQFIGATALASIPVALALEDTLVLAQGARPDAANTPAGRVLRQIAAENARAYNETRRRGVRVEDYRIASAGLRVFAALNLDDDLRRAANQHGRAHGRRSSLRQHVDHGRLQHELRQLGVAVPAGEVERLALAHEPVGKALDDVLASGFSASAHFRALAALLDEAGTSVARLDGPGGVRRVIALDCGKYAYEMQILSFMTAVLCLSGNIPGCLAAETSLLLISAAMYYGGC